MLRSRAIPFLAALALAGCGGGNEEAVSEATPTPTVSVQASPEPTPAAGECDEVKYAPQETSGFRHPERNVYEPDTPNPPSRGDLDHLLLFDNAVVVTYAADTPRKTRDRLSEWAFTVDRTPIVVPDSSPDALPVRAQVGTFELRCNGFDFKRLTAFANRTDVEPSTHGG